MVALVSTQGTISLCDAITGWTGDNFILDPDIKTEGTNSVTCALTTNGNNDIYNAGTWDLSSTHLRLSINISFIAYLTATNPIQISLYDGTNTGYVTVVASNTDYSGGWIDVIVDTALFTTVTLSTVTRVGVRFVTSSKPRNIINTWLDNWRYNNGYAITSTTTESVSFAQAATEDALSPYGILVDIDDVLFATGELLLGSTGSSNLNLVSDNEQIVFPDRKVDTALYKLKTQQGTGNTDIDMKGLVCKTAGGTGAELDLSSSLNTFSVTGSTFISMGAITITPTVTSPIFETTGFTNCGTTSLNLEAEACSWTACDSISLGISGLLTNCSIKETTAVQAVSTTSLEKISGCSFVSDGSSNAVSLTDISSSPETWDNTLSGYDIGSTGNGVQVTGASITGNEAIHITATTGTYVLNVGDTATVPSVSSGGAIVNVLAGQKTLTFTDLPDGVEVRVRQGSFSIYYVASATGGSEAYTYSYVAGTLVQITVGGSGYVRQTVQRTLENANASISFALEPDPSYIS